MAEMFSAPRAARMREYMKTFAAQFGIHDMGSPSRLPNTRRVLAMAELARDVGRLDAFRHHAMNAHWTEGKDLESPSHLLGIAAAAGLDPEKALQAGTDPAYLERVAAERRKGHARGVTGIPTFFFGALPVVGCQPYEVLAATARRAGAIPRDGRG